MNSLAPSLSGSSAFSLAAQVNAGLGAVSIAEVWSLIVQRTKAGGSYRKSWVLASQLVAGGRRHKIILYDALFLLLMFKYF